MFKAIDVDDKKWVQFGKWCKANDTTIRKELDKFLNKFYKGEKDER